MSEGWNQTYCETNDTEVVEKMNGTKFYGSK